MERKIGEIFEYKGEWYQYIKDNCHDCTLFKNLVCIYASHDCWLKAKCKKLKPIGDPYILYDHIVQRYAGVTAPVVAINGLYTIYNPINNTVDIEVKQDKENTEDMEANEKTIPVPEGWEFDRIDDNGNIVLKEKKKELPKTWLECLRTVNETEYINDCSETEKHDKVEDMERDGVLLGNRDRNLLPLGLATPMLALCQLLVCRNAWWKQLGWKPDWKGEEDKYCIYNTEGNIESLVFNFNNRILAFPDMETANKFYEAFKDLIEEAKELL